MWNTTKHEKMPILEVLEFSSRAYTYKNLTIHNLYGFATIICQDRILASSIAVIIRIQCRTAQAIATHWLRCAVSIKKRHFYTSLCSSQKRDTINPYRLDKFTYFPCKVTIDIGARELIQILIYKNKNISIPMHNRKAKMVMSIEHGDALLQEPIFNQECFLLHVQHAMPP